MTTFLLVLVYGTVVVITQIPFLNVPKISTTNTTQILETNKIPITRLNFKINGSSLNESEQNKLIYQLGKNLAVTEIFVISPDKNRLDITYYIHIMEEIQLNGTNFTLEKLYNRSILLGIVPIIPISGQEKLRKTDVIYFNGHSYNPSKLIPYRSHTLFPIPKKLYTFSGIIPPIERTVNFIDSNTVAVNVSEPLDYIATKGVSAKIVIYPAYSYATFSYDGSKRNIIQPIILRHAPHYFIAMNSPSNRYKLDNIKWINIVPVYNTNPNSNNYTNLYASEKALIIVYHNILKYKLSLFLILVFMFFLGGGIDSILGIIIDNKPVSNLKLLHLSILWGVYLVILVYVLFL